MEMEMAMMRRRAATGHGWRTRSASRGVCRSIAALALTLPILGCSDSSGDEARLDFSGEHRLEMEAEFHPAENISIVESVLYGPSSDAVELEQTSYELIRACVEDAGFEYPATFPSSDLLLGEIQPILPTLSVEQAQSRGYGFSELPVTAQRDSLAEYRAALESDAHRSAFDSTLLHCAEAAHDTLFRDYGLYDEQRGVLESKRIEFYTAFDASDEVRSLEKEWSKCMGGAGYEVDAHWDAVGLAAGGQSVQQGHSPDISTEVRVAVADAQCRLATNFEQRYLDLFRDAESAFVFDNEALLLEVIDLRFGKLNQQ